MPKTFKPLLAGKIANDADYEKIRFPVIATPKLDGIRVLMKDGKLWTRSLKKPLPNAAIQTYAQNNFPNNIDGEIITYWDEACTHMKKLNEISSDVMSYDGEPYWLFHAFDDFTIMDLPYQERLVSLYTKIENQGKIVFVPPVRIQDKAELLQYHAENVGAGWEGTMIRAPFGPYKPSRSTLNENILVKLKDFLDDEAEIVGFEELLHNNNEAKTNALGKTERSSHKANLVPGNTLGALKCRWKKGPDFNIGTGFDAATRQKIWDNKEYYLGKKVTFKYQTILKDAPEFPVFITVREDL